MVPSPATGLLATHPAGKAGAVTESQFSLHGPDGVGLTVGDDEGVGVGEVSGVGEGPPLPTS